MNEYSKFLFLKSTIEELFGRKAWYELKESNYVPTWRKHIINTLKAVKISIHDTVKYCDNDWIKEIEQIVERGIELAKQGKSIDELISILAGCMTAISFMQIGLMPHRKGLDKKIALRKGNWNLSKYRTVVYLQTDEQKESLYMNKQQKKIGYEKQMELRREYFMSGSKMTYPEWCENHLDNNA